MQPVIMEISLLTELCLGVVLPLLWLSSRHVPTVHVFVHIKFRGTTDSPGDGQEDFDVHLAHRL